MQNEQRVRHEPPESGFGWCLRNPETLFRYHLDDARFLLIHPGHGVVFSAEDEEELEAKLSQVRPSIRRQLFITCTSLWVCEGEA